MKNNMTADQLREVFEKNGLTPLPHLVLNALECHEVWTSETVAEVLAANITVDHMLLIYNALPKYYTAIEDDLCTTSRGLAFLKKNLDKLPHIPYEIELEMEAEYRKLAYTQATRLLQTWVNSRNLYNCTEPIPSYKSKFPEIADIDYTVQNVVDTSYRRMMSNPYFWHGATKRVFAKAVKSCTDPKSDFLKALLEKNPFEEDANFCYDMITKAKVVYAYYQAKPLFATLPISLTFDVMCRNIATFDLYCTYHRLTVAEILRSPMEWILQLSDDDALGNIIETTAANRESLPELYQKFVEEDFLESEDEDDTDEA